MTRRMLTAALAASLGIVGCDEDPSGDASNDPIELVGSWVSEFGKESITETHWDGFCEQVITRFDNEANVAVLETVGGVEGCGGGFSRVVWNDIAGDTFYYCTTTFGQPSADAAAAAPEVGIDDGDMAKGCATFPWSKLTRK